MNKGFVRFLTWGVGLSVLWCMGTMALAVLVFRGIDTTASDSYEAGYQLGQALAPSVCITCPAVALIALIALGMWWQEKRQNRTL